MTLRLVLLDLDDTLVDHRGAVADGITAHLAARGLLDASDAAERDRAVALWVALEEEHYHRYLAGELDYTGQRPRSRRTTPRRTPGSAATSPGTRRRGGRCRARTRPSTRSRAGTRACASAS
jgi:hypothetical protein